MSHTNKHLRVYLSNKYTKDLFGYVMLVSVMRIPVCWSTSCVGNMGCPILIRAPGTPFSDVPMLRTTGWGYLQGLQHPQIA